jgi:aminopeptidase N
MPDGQSRIPVFLKDYSAPAFTVDTVELNFDLDPEATIVRARLTLTRNAPGPVVLDGRALELRQVAIDGEVLGPNRYTVTESTLTIADVPQNFVLETEVKICPEQNTELSGLYMSGAGFFTQCEPEGFRKITYFPDRPDVMARYKVTMAADPARYPVLLSNGNQTASGEANGKRWATWEDPHPKPSYLFALVAGDLVAVKDSFTTKSGRHVDLGIYVEAGEEQKTAHAMEALKKSMAWDEQVFGLEYDLDIFNIAAVSDFNAGAMENKGLNIFNTAYVLASPETATDADFQGVERVIAHEYFHNWTGDRVTCRDWFQLSLKEGLTVFRDQEYMADQFSAPVKRIADVRLLRSTQFRDDAGPLAHPVRPASFLEINNFYTTTIYEKGAEVVRMYRTLLGREAFLRGIALYIERHDNSAATVEDFFQAMQDVAEIDLSQIMRWYEQAGTPNITFTEEYDQDQKRFTLTLRQHTAPTPGQPEKKPFLIPVAMGLLAPDGHEVHAETLVLHEAEQSFIFENITAPPVVSLFRNFSAPVKLLGQSLGAKAFLAAHDTDLFNRWDALQDYAAQILLAQPSGSLDAGLTDAFRAILAGADSDPAFAAEALILPSETLLADQMNVVDPDAIHAIRERTRQQLGEALRPKFHAAMRPVDPADLSAAAMAQRALNSTALSYLCAAGETQLAEAQFVQAGNMTESLAALANLAEQATPARDAALEAFYQRWKATPLVLDKWFSVQARAGAPDTLARVQALKNHPDFDLRNPNRVRALIGAFAANQVQFHEKSGAGYALLADTIIALDARNPQIAARLTTGLGTWRRYDAARQGLMKAALERILGKEKLSHNTYEMASKSLA